MARRPPQRSRRGLQRQMSARLMDEIQLTQLMARRMTCGFLKNVRTSNARPDALPAPYAPPPSIGSPYETVCWVARRCSDVSCPCWVIENSTRRPLSSFHRGADRRLPWSGWRYGRRAGHCAVRRSVTRSYYAAAAALQRRRQQQQPQLQQLAWPY